jgi:hypothetical protein
LIKPLIKKSFSVYLLNFTLLGFLVGCTSPIIKEGDAPSGVDYVRWVPKEYRAPVEARLPRPKELWWQDFGSDELNSLVETAVTNNFDLRVAIARVAQTRAQADLVKSAQYPTLDAKAGYNSIAPYPNIGSAASTSQWTSHGTWQAGLLASYEVNLWGKQGFDTKSAFAQALASEFNREAVALSLVGDVITTGTNHSGLCALQHDDQAVQEIDKLGKLKVSISDSLRRTWPREPFKDLLENIYKLGKR